MLLSPLTPLLMAPRLPSHALSMCAVELLELPSHVRFLNDVALTMPPPGMAAAASLLTQRGEELVEPGVDRTLHPLLVPLTRSSVDGEVTGLLRWPGASGGATKLPLVRTRGSQLELLAPCAEHYVIREFVLADAEGGVDAADLDVLEALAAACGLEYERGAAAKSPGGIPGYLITRVGPFSQEYERLATGHLAKGSEQAGLIACERAQQCFGAWGRPFAFHAQRLRELGRNEEARDLARQALEQPLWTLGAALDEVLALAESSREELLARVELKAAGKMTPEQLRANNGMDQRTPQQIAKDRATYVMDLAVAAPHTHTWASTRESIAALYTQADMVAVATFINLEVPAA